MLPQCLEIALCSGCDNPTATHNYLSEVVAYNRMKIKEIPKLSTPQVVVVAY